ncbi:WD40 repeat domain-containing protein [Pseudophaeobacter sp.]|uniref:WD40 repeat domain-containing protein n=1 Tax=Pseudophaeobacter sp. TaxID=1971739 RepID=UPI00262C0AB7|nr:WD40 repeat domain-containing protein [Pseudophaeobacter sp.]
MSSGSEIRRLEGHEGGAETAVFSLDGRRVLTASADKTARLWETATGLELQRFEGHQGAVRSAVFSIDYKRVLTASEDGSARLWDTAGKKPVPQTDRHNSRISNGVFSPDGEKLLTSSSDKTARLWNVSDGAEIRCFDAHESPVEIAVFSSDGQWAMTNSENGVARYWDILTDVNKFCFMCPREQDIGTFFSSRAGKLRVLNLGDNTTRFYDTAGHEICHFLDSDARIENEVISPNGKEMLTASLRGNVWLSDIRNGNIVTKLEGHVGEVYSAAFFPGGDKAVTAGEDRTVRFWDLATGGEVQILFFDNKPTALAISATKLFVGDITGQLHFFSI